MRKKAAGFHRVLSKDWEHTLPCPDMTGQPVFAAEVKGQGGENEEGVLKATGRATGSSQCRYMALCLRLLSRPYNEWMLARAQKRCGNNRHRKACALVLLVSWVCIQRAGTQTKQNTRHRVQKERRSCTDTPIKYKPRKMLI